MASFALPTPARNAAFVAIASGVAAAAIVLLLVGSWIAAAGFFAAAVIVIGALIAWRLLNPVAKDAPRPVDWDLTRTVAEAGTDALAITDRAGRLVCANDAYEALFEGFPTPPGLPLDEAGNAALADAGRSAWRDGTAQVERLNARNVCLSAQIARAGDDADMLVWRFVTAQEHDLAETLAALLTGPTGDRLGGSGIMAALLSPDGRVRTANRVLRARACGDEYDSIEGRDFARFLITDSRGLVRFEREGLEGTPLRVLQIPFLDGDDAPVLVALLDEEENAPRSAPAPPPTSAASSA